MFSNIKTLFFFAKSYNFLACQDFKHIGFSIITCFLYFNAIKTVTPNDIIDLANKYLQEKDLLECVVGKNL
jgi:predicted Zn-dependent peptidase